MVAFSLFLNTCRKKFGKVFEALLSQLRKEHLSVALCHSDFWPQRASQLITEKASVYIKLWCFLKQNNCRNSMLFLDISPDWRKYAFLEVKPCLLDVNYLPSRDFNLSVTHLKCGSPALPVLVPYVCLLCFTMNLTGIYSYFIFVWVLKQSSKLSLSGFQGLRVWSEWAWPSLPDSKCMALWLSLKDRNANEFL